MYEVQYSCPSSSFCLFTLLCPVAFVNPSAQISSTHLIQELSERIVKKKKVQMRLVEVVRRGSGKSKFRGQE